MFIIKIDASPLRALERDLDRIRARIPQAIARGLNEGGDKVRTRVQRALKEQTNVKAYSSITSRMRTARAFAGQGDTTASVKGSGVGGGMVYQIIATGHGIPIKEFPVSVVAKGVDAKTWGVDHLFQRSFQQKFKGGLRARLGPGRFPTRSLLGPALPKELEKGKVPGVFYLACGEFVGPAILKHLANLLR